MIKRKDINKRVEDLEKQEEHIYDEDNRVIVNINVRDDDEFLSNYGFEENAVISQETANFLEHAIKPINYKENLTLAIHSDVITEDEKHLYEKGIRNYYKNSLLQEKKHLDLNLKSTLFLLLAGIVYFALLTLVSFFLKNDLWIEVLSIVGWVFIWEAVEVFFLERPKLRRMKYRYYALMNAKIIFIDVKRKEEI